jgi:predicted nucleic acid-binding protein
LRLERVVDANVVAKLFVTEEFSDKARKLLTTSAIRVYAPDFMYLECTNILLKYTRRFGVPLETALRNLPELQRLRLRSISTSPFLEPAIKLASRHELSAYDAVYAALSQTLEAPLVTADEKLIRKLEGSSVDVRFLGDLSL